MKAGNLERDIGTILAKLESIEKWMKEHAAQDRELEKRIQSVERRQWYAYGAVAAVGVVWTIFTTLIGIKV